jgi:hypothetical protein
MQKTIRELSFTELQSTVGGANMYGAVVYMQAPVTLKEPKLTLPAFP